VPKIPRATYRLQFHKDFTFQDAAAICDYLDALGVSHIYASPYLQAAPGSTHGYDVVDYSRVNHEIGGWSGHEMLCHALTQNGLGQILDIVPNHMAIISPENRWWSDVLENGPSSRYASYFDVDWDHGEDTPGNTILLPVLADHYGRVLDALEIQLHQEKGMFTFRYQDHVLPVAPNSLAGLLRVAAVRANSDVLGFFADSLAGLPLPITTDRQSIRKRHRDKEVIRGLLARLLEEQPEVADAVDMAVREVNADPKALHSLLEQQIYRLAFWRKAGHELGYRRFFDINTLAGLHIEDETVFSDVHELVLRWLQSGILEGLRVDHPDGLWDPLEYFRRLRNDAPGAWIVVEKILQPSEQLPNDWPVDGTTGYDFLNITGGLFVAPRGEKPLTDFYVKFTGDRADYPALVREKKHQVLNELLGSDVNRLTDLMVKIFGHHPRYRDFTRHEIHEAIQEMAACFPVYRTYIRAYVGQITDADRDLIARTADAAKSLRSDIDADLFDFLRDVILLRQEGDLEKEFVMRFQQLTAPAAAKGIEDTAFYCFTRFAALNEVGGNPGRFGTSIAAFHQTMKQRYLHFPHTMLATSTHDTKRSEDVRSRLYLLSEIPGQWAQAVERWSTRNERHRRNGFPDRNIEYLFYQTLVGAWPISLERMTAYMRKAIHEAKKYTSWTRPDPVYEDAVLGFVEKTYSDKQFMHDLEAFVQPLIVPGRINSLALTLLKLTAPGVPDIYQGMELWDLSLVDPDNRHGVDYVLRRTLLDRLDSANPEEVLGDWESGMPKLWIIRQALRLRRKMPDIFDAGAYQPLPVKGTKARHAVAFLRGNGAATICPRLFFSLAGDWGNTRIVLPEGDWLNELTGDSHQGGEVMLKDLLKRFPVAFLSGKGQT
jgi:(1->4)-alpha-D-glucan 1-alpha-D-glucosylmutase